MPVSQKKFYTIGKGCLYLSDSRNINLRQVGNAPGFNVTFEIEKLEHYSSKQGPKTLDESIVTQQKATGQIILDEPNIENVNLFFMGDGAQDKSQTAGTATTVDIANVEQGRWSIIGADDISNVVVEDETQTTTYTLDTDYQLDLVNGLICIVEGGGISNGDNIKVTYDNPAKTIEGVNALKSKTIEKYVYFYGNPDMGVTQKIIGRATISPSGDFSFIQDAEWQQMTLDIEFLEDANVDGLFEYCGSGVTGN